MQTKRQLKRCARNVHPSFADFRPGLGVNFHILLTQNWLGVKFIFIISLMHTLSDNVRFVERTLKPEEAFTTKNWMVLAEHLLAQALFSIDGLQMYNCMHWAIEIFRAQQKRGSVLRCHLSTNASDRNRSMVSPTRQWYFPFVEVSLYVTQKL